MFCRNSCFALPASDFSCFMLRALFLCRPPLAILLPAKQLLCGLRLGRVLSFLWEGKYLAVWSVGKASRSRPVGCSIAGRTGRMPASTICVFSLAIFHVGTVLQPLPAIQSLRELRLLTEEVLGANTLLVRLQEAAYSRRRQTSGPTGRPGARRKS